MIRVLIVLALSLAGGPFFPWWWPSVAGVLTGLWKPRRKVSNFLTAAIGAGLAWGGMATFYDWRNHGLLAGKIAGLFHLSGGVAMILLTALVGGATAGIGALLGGRFRLFWSSLSAALAAQDVILPPDKEWKVKGKE